MMIAQISLKTPHFESDFRRTVYYSGWMVECTDLVCGYDWNRIKECKLQEQMDNSRLDEQVICWKVQNSSKTKKGRLHKADDLIILIIGTIITEPEAPSDLSVPL